MEEEVITITLERFNALVSASSIAETGRLEVVRQLEEWRQRGASAAIRGASISEDRDYMARIYGPTRDKNNELERMVGDLSDRLRVSEAENEALRAKAALADLHTQEESPPLPNGIVLVQHRFAGVETRLHPKGQGPCVICDALTQTGGADEQ